ncbi:MAG: hypothetical protein GTO63_28250, partial [Anaerolineae bacterium]|nr:hypothetical protein [Anaerolineae bacterium]NIN98629.1 hypothetical protein [Anaerolineae bacterium]NIQ81516.1 hypothetical protein [Anaerolineae bacterium]
MAVHGREPGHELDRTVGKTIRALAMDPVQEASSGHPGVRMGMAEAAYVEPVLVMPIAVHNRASPSPLLWCRV